MSWEDRLREAAYTSPSGARFTFVYEDVSRAVGKRTPAYECPDVNGTLVKDLGHSSGRYPLRCIFWGENYDLVAVAFEAALLEKGVGRLEHPIYGALDVVPFGDIARTDNLKTEGNQATVEVVFWETVGADYPSSQVDKAEAVILSVNKCNEDIAEVFKKTVSVSTVAEKASIKARFKSLIDKASTGLKAAYAADASANKIFKNIETSINIGIDTLISDPLTLAFQTMQLLQAPARSSALIVDRLNAYKDLVNAILSNTFKPTEKNNFHLADLFATGYIAGAVVSVVNNEFFTKREAVDAASSIYDQYGAYVAWRDSNMRTLSAIDTGEAYQSLQQSVALMLGYLVEISFTLKQERTLILDRNRTIIDLVAELYGSIDDKLDFFINSNNLTGSEILEIPIGRRIVYYV